MNASFLSITCEYEVYFRLIVVVIWGYDKDEKAIVIISSSCDVLEWN